MESTPVALAIVVVLQAPYVSATARRSGEPGALGDALWSWVAESMMPLLGVLQRLEHEQVEAPFSVAISPLTCEMLADIHARTAFPQYLERQAERARVHARCFGERGQESLRDAALFWEAWYLLCEREFRDTHALDPLDALRGFASRGRVELLATPATGAPLPLLLCASSVQAQISVAAQTFKKYFGQAGRGLWACHGLQHEALGKSLVESRGSLTARMIARAGFEFVVEGAPTTLASHAARDGGTRGEANLSPGLRRALPGIESDSLPPGDHAPRLSHGLLWLRPHAALAEQLWHAQGYAGEELFLSTRRRLLPGALRLWRNTRANTALSMLETYEAHATSAICEAQAEHWLDRVHASASQSSNHEQCVALDASLLGTRWFEGHAWLARALKRAARDTRFELGFASRALTLNALASRQSDEAGEHVGPQAGHTRAEPAGEAAGATAWRNEFNEEMWPQVHGCEAQMEHWARRCANTSNPKLREALNQCARELLLIQSGEWPLALTARPPQPEREDDAGSRLAEHIEAFRRLCSIASAIESGAFISEGERALMDALCERDDLFPDLSFELWAEII